MRHIYLTFSVGLQSAGSGGARPLGAYNSLVIPRSRGLVVACTANFVMCVRLGLGRQRWKCGGERGGGLREEGRGGG